MALLQVSLCGPGPVDNLPGQAETQLISAGDQVLQVLCLMRLTLPRIFIPGWDVKFSSTILKQLLVNVRLVIQDLKCKPFFGFFSCKGLTLPVCQCSTLPVCHCASVPLYQCATVPGCQCATVSSVPQQVHLWNAALHQNCIQPSQN